MRIGERRWRFMTADRVSSQSTGHAVVPEPLRPGCAAALRAMNYICSLWMPHAHAAGYAAWMPLGRASARAPPLPPFSAGATEGMRCQLPASTGSATGPAATPSRPTEHAQRKCRPCRPVSPDRAPEGAAAGLPWYALLLPPSPRPPNPSRQHQMAARGSSCQAPSLRFIRQVGMVTMPSPPAHGHICFANAGKLHGGFAPPPRPALRSKGVKPCRPAHTHTPPCPAAVAALLVPPRARDGRLCRHT